MAVTYKRSSIRDNNLPHCVCHNYGNTFLGNLVLLFYHKLSEEQVDVLFLKISCCAVTGMNQECTHVVNLSVFAMPCYELLKLAFHNS